MLDPHKIKRDFPMFANNPHLVYLDSTATSLKPQCVIDKEAEYYKNYCANVYRGIYQISEKATEEFEATRDSVAKFIHAKGPEEIIFTRSTSESINLLATCLGDRIEKGDEIVSTVMEHHSNFVPWQYIAQKKKATFKVLGIDEAGNLDVYCDSITGNCIGKIYLEEIITSKTKVFAFTYVSNVLGTITEVKKIAMAAKKINKDIIIIVDAAQAAPRGCIDVSSMGVDFVAFSSHKMLGPTGVGVLWGKYELLEELPPYNLGGEMIAMVTIEKTEYKKPPHKFEAGTPHIAGVIGLGEAVRYINNITPSEIESHEDILVQKAYTRLKEEFGADIMIIGPSDKAPRSGLISFTIKGLHPHDTARLLDEEGVAVRAGTHCAMPLHKAYGITATTRASFYLYNTLDDVEALVKALKKAYTLFTR